jgi:hypothetical protein
METPLAIHGPHCFKLARLDDYRRTFDQLPPLEQCILTAKRALKTKLSRDIILYTVSEIIFLDSSEIDAIAERAIIMLETQTPHRVMYKPKADKTALILLDSRKHLADIIHSP